MSEVQPRTLVVAHMIKLKYSINGALFRREYPSSEAHLAEARIAALVQSGITVVVRGIGKVRTVQGQKGGHK